MRVGEKKRGRRFNSSSGADKGVETNTRALKH
jgi:hypothetical protein